MLIKDDIEMTNRYLSCLYAFLFVCLFLFVSIPTLFLFSPLPTVGAEDAI